MRAKNLVFAKNLADKAAALAAQLARTVAPLPIAQRATHPTARVAIPRFPHDRDAAWHFACSLRATSFFRNLREDNNLP